VVYDWNVSIVVISLLFACFLPLWAKNTTSKIGLHEHYNELKDMMEWKINMMVF